MKPRISLMQISRALLKRLWILLLCAAVGAGATYFCVARLQKDTYTASATMYVYNANPNMVNYQYTSTTDLNSATRLLQTYMVVIKSNKVMDVVAERLGGLYTTDEIAGCISLGSVSGTEVMQINVTTDNADISMRICNAVAEAAPSEIVRVVNAGSAEVIDYATLPVIPDDRNPLRKALVVALAFAALACAVVILFASLDQRIRGEDDLTDLFSVPILGAIPEMDACVRFEESKVKGCKTTREIQKPAKTGSSAEGYTKYIIHNETSPAIVEAYRTLRTNLRVAMLRKKCRTVLISSAVPHEGKSTLSTNLAIIAARDMQRVLLIDADMRKARRGNYSDAPRDAKGLSDYLSGDAELKDALIKDIRTRLDFIPAGRAPASPSEMLGSARMHELLNKVSGMYDIVILDTPPMNVVSDAMSFADGSAAILFAVRQNYSSRKDVEAALRSVNFVNIPLLGFALTHADIHRTNAYRHYYKYYRSYFDD